MKNRIISILITLSVLLAQVNVFAALDYDENYGSAASSEVPSSSEIRTQMQLARDKANIDLMTEIGSKDYSQYIARTDNITVDVDENNQWRMNKEVLGIQYEFNDKYNTYYENGELKADYVEFASSDRVGKIPLIRFGGGSSSTINMMHNVGPESERTATDVVKVPGVPGLGGRGGAAAYRMGPAETLKMIYVNNPDAELLMCLSMYATPKEDVVNLAHYLLDDKDESEWGALRAADGIENPVKVWYWELENESDGWGAPRTEARIDQYVLRANEAIDAIRSVDPEAKIMVNGPTAPWGDYWGIEEYTPASWTSWHMGILPQLIERVDGISMHPYYDGYAAEFGAMYFADKVKADAQKMIEEKDIRDKSGNLKDFEIIITEHNRWVDVSKINFDFQSAMSVAHFYNLCFAREWITGATLHNLEGGWCSFWYTDSGEFVMTPTAKMHKAYLENLGDRVCEAKWIRQNDDGTIYNPDDDPYFEGNDFSVVAMPSGNHELKIFMTNKVAYRNINIHFTFKNNYTLVSETVVKAPNSATLAQTRDMEDLTTIKTTEKNIPNFSEYTTPTEGFIVLTLKTNDYIPKLGEENTSGEGVNIEAPEVTELAFSDINDSYAKNEICALYEAGVINGKGEGIFAPLDCITNAELAVFIGKCLGYKQYYGNIWKDITRNSWYEGYANAAAVENIMHGEYFNPYETVTIGNLLKIAGKICINHDAAYENGYIFGDNEFLNADTAYAINKGLASKLFQNEVDLTRTATREDAASVVYRLGRIVK